MLGSMLVHIGGLMKTLFLSMNICAVLYAPCSLAASDTSLSIALAKQDDQLFLTKIRTMPHKTPEDFAVVRAMFDDVHMALSQELDDLQNRQSTYLALQYALPLLRRHFMYAEHEVIPEEEKGQIKSRMEELQKRQLEVESRFSSQGPQRRLAPMLSGKRVPY